MHLMYLFSFIFLDVFFFPKERKKKNWYMVWSTPNIKNFKQNIHTIQKHVKLIPDHMTILMERPAPAGLMWKTDWVPDWDSIYTSLWQLIYHEPKPTSSHLCVSVRLFWIVTPF